MWKEFNFNRVSLKFWNKMLYFSTVNFPSIRYPGQYWKYQGIIRDLECTGTNTGATRAVISASPDFNYLLETCGRRLLGPSQLYCEISKLDNGLRVAIVFRYVLYVCVSMYVGSWNFFSYLWVWNVSLKT